MPEYICKRCNYKTRQRSDYRKHLVNRKTPCPPDFSNIEPNQLLYELEHGMKSFSTISNHKELSKMNNEEITDLYDKVKSYLQMIESYMKPKVDISSINSFGEECIDHITEEAISFILKVRLDVTKDRNFLFIYLQSSR